jgi:hypothetical protein
MSPFWEMRYTALRGETIETPVKAKVGFEIMNAWSYLAIPVQNSALEKRVPRKF